MPTYICVYIYVLQSFLLNNHSEIDSLWKCNDKRKIMWTSNALYTKANINVHKQANEFVTNPYK